MLKHKAALVTLALVLSAPGWLKTNVIQPAEGSKPSLPAASSLKLKEGELLRSLNPNQKKLIDHNPGTLVAVARALKMAIIECQYQMRNELWDCPVYSFSPEPVEMFGKLMSRTCKETSFVRSLMNAALTHSVARACTDGSILTCTRREMRDGSFRENVEFGQSFAREFMNSTYDLGTESSYVSNGTDRTSNEIAPPRPAEFDKLPYSSGKHRATRSKHQKRSHEQQQETQSIQTQGVGNEQPNRAIRDMTIRDRINAHNDNLGRLVVENSMRLACKCYGLSGACNMQTCYKKLPPFREVSNQLRIGFDRASRLEYVTHGPISSFKSLTSTATAQTSTRKSNKKRSSSHQQLNGLSRSSTSLSQYPQSVSSVRSSHMPSGRLSFGTQFHSQDGEVSNMIGSRSSRGAKRHTKFEDCEDCHRPSDQPLAQSLTSNISPNSLASDLLHSNITSNMGPTIVGERFGSTDQIGPRLSRLSVANSTSTLEKRPVARAIGYKPVEWVLISELDMIYRLNAPDLCTPDERYDIRGTKGRHCSENATAQGSCQYLCCGRGYKREVREEKYNCECQFNFCCQMDCKTCTRPKQINKCL